MDIDAEPLVSVIVPAWNNEAHIGQAVRSVLDQSYEAFELLVVDDGCTDLTIPVVESFADPRIRILTTSSRAGAATARNIGQQAARGEIIAFLDSDDLWAPDKLRAQVEFMQENNAAFTYTRFDIIDEQGSPIAPSKALPAYATYARLLPYCFIRTSSVAYRPQQTGGLVRFPPLAKRQDFGLFLALLRRVPKALLVNAPLCSYRLRKNSVSSNKLANVTYQWRIYREIEQIGPVLSMYYMTAWSFRSFFTFAERTIQGLRRKRSP